MWKIENAGGKNLDENFSVARSRDGDVVDRH
jgi:hypothetical protein